jgi:nudix-type nucleoside diphosphatase (YffH/AdpP family)
MMAGAKPEQLSDRAAKDRQRREMGTLGPEILTSRGMLRSSTGGTATCITCLVHMSVRIVESKALFEGWTKFVLVTISKSGGLAKQRAVLDHGDSACVLAYDPERRMALMVDQTRVPLLYLGHRNRLMEAIAGRIEDEQPTGAIRREAEEEAGLRIRELERVATCWASPGVSTERFHLYIAAYSSADRVGHGGGRADELEDITVHEVALSELSRRADSRKLEDAKTLLLVQTLRLRRPDLFD